MESATPTTSQRSRFLAFLGGLCVLGIYGQSELIRSYLLRDFQQLEETQVRSNLRLINLWLDRFLQPLETLAPDAATWPETAQFLATGDRTLLDTRLELALAGNIEFDVAAVLDMDGVPTYAAAFEPSLGALGPVPSSLLPLLRRHVDAYRASGERQQFGWMADGDGLLASASIVIPTHGPPQVVLVFGRRFPAAELQSLSELGATRVEVVAPESAPADAYRPGALRGEFRRGGGDDALTLCRQLTPPLNPSGRLLCVELEESIYLRGKASADDLRLASMAGFIVLIFGAWLFLDQALLRRLATLTRHLTTAGGDTQALEHTLFVDSRRQDELGLLTGGMSQLLGRVRHVERDLREQEQSFRTLSESTGVAIFVQTRTLDYANPFAVHLTGYAAGELRGRQILDLLDADDRPRVARKLAAPDDAAAAEPEPVQGIRKNGERYWARLHVASIQYQGSPALLVTLYDVSEQRHLEARLSQQGERQRVILESIQEGIVSLDAAGRVDYVNPTAERLLGLTAGEAVGKPVEGVIHLSDPETDQPLRLPELPGPGPAERQPQVLAQIASHHGEARLVELRVSRLRADGAASPGRMLVLRDVSELRKMARNLEHQATHDELTGLINRREFSRRLSAALESSRHGGRPHALCYIDLDQFKIVNDTCGHHAGDLLLRQIAGALMQRVRAEDTLGRLGGDEFGLLLADSTAEGAVTVANALRQTISEIRFTWAGRVFSVDASIGIAMLADVEGGIDEALATADATCFVAKDTGRNRVRLHRAGDTDLEEQFGQMRWAQRLKDALEKGRLHLYRQEIRGLRAGDTGWRAYEILLRLHDVDGSVITAGEFLGAAERYQMMLGIDSFVVTRVLEHLRGERSAGREPPHLFVNLSGLSLGDDSFRSFLSAALDRDPELAHHLTFEVTETAVISNLGRARRLMEVLLQKGCSLALDDFGTGMSSFAYLKEMDVQFLKIAGPFVRGMGQNPLDASIVSTFANLARSMNVRTIAEEVENEATLQALRRLHVDFAQGFYLDRPRPLLSEVAPAA